MTAGVTNFPGAVDTKETLLEASNRFQTTLNGALTDVATSMTVVSTTGAPTAGAVTIDDERIFYTGKTATTFTGLLRGQDGSGAAAHSSGAAVEGRIIARHVNVLQDAIIALETAVLAVEATAARAAMPQPIINGGFDIWQRGTSFATIADAAYSVDRWRYGKVGAMVHTVSRSTDVPAVSSTSPLQNYSALIDCTTVDSSIAAGDYCVFSQRIEGFRFLGFAQREFTLSFWVKGTKTGIHCVAFRNSVPDRSYVAEYTINAANTWEYKTITVSASPSAGTWDYTAGIGLTVAFALACGSTFQTTANAWQTGNFYGTASQVNACDNTANDFRLAMVQLDLGGGAGSFRATPFAEQLALCQRYFCKTFPYATAPASNVGSDVGCLVYTSPVSGAITHAYQWLFPVAMRAAPTVTTYNPHAAGSNWRNLDLGANSAAGAVLNATDDSVVVYNDQVSGDTQEDFIVVHATASAEL
jgi:hypothetical protein